MRKSHRLISWFALVCTAGAGGLAIVAGNLWGIVAMFCCAAGIAYGLWQTRNSESGG